MNACVKQALTRERTPQFRQGLLGVLESQRLGVFKAVWLFAYYALASHLPDDPMPGSRLANRLRVSLAKRIFKRIGREVKIHAKVCFGSGVNIEIGDYSSLNHSCWIANDTVIGTDVMMGPEIIILSGSHSCNDVTKPMREQGAPRRRPVVIGDDVWIGTRAIILPGVHVGSHAIIGAGSVVTKHVEEWAIVAGNPARKIRSRLEARDGGWSDDLTAPPCSAENQ